MGNGKWERAAVKTGVRGARDEEATSGRCYLSGEEAGQLKTEAGDQFEDYVVLQVSHCNTHGVEALGLDELGGNE